MNNLTIPPCPNWYESQIMACAEDKTLVYGSNSTLVILEPKDVDQPASVKLIPFAHTEKIHSVSVNPGWSASKKLAVTVGSDKMVKLWNLETYELSMCNKTHTVFESKLVGATFAGNDRVISVSEDSLVLIWRLTTNTSTPIKNFLGIKSQVTCISSCPHASWLVAFGLKKGRVIIADMRKTGTVIHRLKESDRDIVCMAWCPTPENIVAKCKKVAPKESADKLKQISSNQVDKLSDKDAGENLNLVENNVIEDNTVEIPKEKSDTIEDAQTIDIGDKSKLLLLNLSDEAFFKEVEETIKLLDNKVNKIENRLEEIETKREDQTNNENDSKPNSEETNVATKKIDTKTLWTNLKFPDDDEIIEDIEITGITPLDFLKECEALKSRISTFKNKEEDHSDAENPHTPVKTKDKPRKVLVAVRNKRKDENYESPSNIENDLCNTTLDEENKESTQSIHNLDNSCPTDEVDLVDKFQKLNTEADVDVQSVEIKLESTKINDQVIEDCDKPMSRSFEAVMDNLKSVCLNHQRNQGQEIKQIKPRPEYLLACSTRDGSIYIWKALSEGRLQVKFSVGKSNRYRSKSDAWIPLHWITPKILLSSGNNGELLRWDVGCNGKFISKVVHQDHHSKMFAISSPLRIYGIDSEDETKLQEDNIGAWTLGQDRMLLFTMLNARREVIYCYPTIGPFQSILASSPVDPNKLAIGTEDGTIKFWDLSRPHFQYIFMANSKLKFSTKITSIAWHPNQECILAFGTSEGKVGKLHSGMLAKGQSFLVHHFKNKIHQLEWGPIPNKSENYGIYVCSEGKVGLYNDDKPFDEPEIIKVSDTEYITQVHWKPDFTLFACGTKNGTIIMLNAKMENLYSLYFQKYSIIKMLWHPLGTAADSDLSPCHYWLAAVTSNDFNVVVYDLENYTPEKMKDMDKTIVANFEGNIKQIQSMAWSQHQSGLLVCAAEDGIAHVYNVITKEVISTFVNTNCDPINDCIWSPLESDFIITTGKESTIRIWNIKEHPKLNIEEILQLRAKRLRGKQNKNKKDKAESIELDSKDKLPKNYIKSIHCASVEHCKKLLSIKESGQGDIADDQVLQFFGSQEDMNQLLTRQINEHNMKGKYPLHDHVSLWKGNIAECLKDAIKENRVTPWLINMAPAVSPKLWSEACEVYAKFLEESNPADPITSASYYLACHKIENAVNILCVHNLFKEALAIAKCRLPYDDPIIVNILNKWGLSTHINGAYELSALCFIAVNKFKEAAQVLFKRTDLKSLELAAKLAQKANDTEMYEAIMLRYNLFKEGGNDQRTIITENASAINIYENRVEAIEAKNVELKDTKAVCDVDEGIEDEMLSDDTPEPVADAISKSQEENVLEDANKVISDVVNENNGENVQKPSETDDSIDLDISID